MIQENMARALAARINGALESGTPTLAELDALRLDADALVAALEPEPDSAPDAEREPMPQSGTAAPPSLPVCRICQCGFQPPPGRARPPLECSDECEQERKRLMRVLKIQPW